MAITFGDLKKEIIKLLSDTIVELPNLPIAGAQTDADLLFHAVKAALTAISQRIWKPAIATLAGGLSEYDTPEDLIDFEAVLDLTENAFLVQTHLVSRAHADSGNTWIDYPFGKITFSQVLGSEGATLYYSALWEFPEEDDDEADMETPDKLALALALYGASYCLLAKASGSADIRQFATKVDSGQPTDIPAKDMSDTFLRRFEIEMGRFPAMRKGSY